MSVWLWGLACPKRSNIHSTTDLLQETTDKEITCRNANSKYTAIQKLQGPWNGRNRRREPLTHIKTPYSSPASSNVFYISKFGESTCNNAIFLQFYHDGGTDFYSAIRKDVSSERMAQRRVYCIRFDIKIFFVVLTQLREKLMKL